MYLTFKEFKNNNPQYTDFTVKKSTLTDELYIKDSTGNERLARNMWGYCNGANIFIRSADNFFMLNRIGNSFYTRGSKKIRTSKHPELNGIVIAEALLGVNQPDIHSREYFSIEYFPYKLDLDNGEIY